jgi:UDP-glucose 4-epimerase
MKNKTVLITGGSGFLGFHLCQTLCDKGYVVTVIDRVPPRSNKISFVLGSFSDWNVVGPLLKKHDIVIHLAAVVGVDMCRLHPEYVKQVNYTDTKAFIDLAKKCGVKRFVFTSSSEVYGNSPRIPYRETAKPTPVSLYGELKVAIEYYLGQMASSSFTVGIPRLFNMYGPGQRKEFVIPIYIDAAIHNKPIRIFGSGEQIRCFTYVGDSVRGIVHVLEHTGEYDIFNIGSEKEVTISELSRLILHKIPFSISRIVHVAYGMEGARERSLEIMRRVPSGDKAKKQLKFSALTDISKGIDHIISQYQYTET